MNKTLYLMIVSIALFVAIAAAMLSGVTMSIDTWSLSVFRRAADPGALLGPEALRFLLVDVTALGSYGVLTIGALVAATILAYFRRWIDVAYLAAMAGLGTLLLRVLKMGFDRPRPDVVPHLVTVTNESFPSGHATMSMVIWLAIAFAATEPGGRARPIAVACAGVVGGIVGVSRVALGVHNITDIVAGWAIAVALVTSGEAIRRRFFGSEDDE